MPIDRQVVRQLDILHNLHTTHRHYGISSTQLAEKYGKDIRTIQRDLNDLREAGFNIISERKPDGQQYLFLESEKLPPIHFPLADISALIFIESISEFLEGTPFKTHLRSVIDRIESITPEKQVGFLRRAAQAYTPHIRGNKTLDANAQAVLSRLNSAILEQKTCQITYRTMGAEKGKTYDIEPLRLLYYMEAGGLYLVGRVPAYGDPITLAVERIQDLEPTKDGFSVSDEIANSIEERLHNSFGIISGEPFEVSISFSSQQAPYIQERTWHPSQKIEVQDDGSIIITFHAGSEYEIKRWVLQFGADAQVLEPKSLQQEIIAELEATLKTYQDIK
ncbi:transcriptional regulator [Candidatus Latescibacteria bacterium]|jgi:predicted DNA-binding transcriptional regulator YafY|nr:transcriptional regulator [Candidatus Latescibacterota bacterium]